MDNTGSYIAYAGLVVGILAKFGITLLPDQAELIIAGVITLIGVVWAHFNHNATLTAARAGHSV